MEAVTGAGAASFWSQADAVTRGTTVLLLVMSVVTWYLILTKTLQAWRLRRGSRRVIVEFWSAPTLEHAVARARAVGRGSPFSTLAEAALAAAGERSDPCAAGLSSALGRSDDVARILRRTLHELYRRLNAGLATLASVGATAPFVGLFGTVWGIYHALSDIGLSGQVSIDKVAGPVGEALIMTALGIAVAVPAVLGYNFLLRANRTVAQEIDGFAHDLHVYLNRTAAGGPAEAQAAGSVQALHLGDP